MGTSHLTNWRETIALIFDSETAGCASGERREEDRATTEEGDTGPDRMEKDGSYRFGMSEREI